MHSKFKILVAIASYGTRNDGYLSQIIREYRSMPFHVDIVVLSNINKKVCKGLEVVVGLPFKNPWSLPFGHKQLFADRLNDYELFIYSEDDMLITESNIRAFLKATEVLPEGEIAGFIRFEKDTDGGTHYPEFHGHFHWDPSSVRSRGGDDFAFFSCEHSACYVLTRDQLQRAIASGGFVVGPHEDKYDLLCTAATDPYTQCGFEKMICISKLDDFSVHHLPNKYIRRMSSEERVVKAQTRFLLSMGRNGNAPHSLIETETKLKHCLYSKDYYEPVQTKIISLIPEGTDSVLSIGSGTGKTESYLAENGFRVTTVPLDPVIAVAMQGDALKVIHCDFKAAGERLRGESYDCLILSNILHLTENPVVILSLLSRLMTRDAVLLSLVPNTTSIPGKWRRFKREGVLRTPFNFEETGVQMTSHSVLRKWHREAGMKIEGIVDILSPRFPRTHKLSRMTLGLMNPHLAEEFAVIAKNA